MNSSTVSWALAREATSFKTQATRSQDGSTLCTVQVRLTCLRFKCSRKVNPSSRSSKLCTNMAKVVVWQVCYLLLPGSLVQLCLQTCASDCRTRCSALWSADSLSSVCEARCVY